MLSICMGDSFPVGESDERNDANVVSRSGYVEFSSD